MAQVDALSELLINNLYRAVELNFKGSDFFFIHPCRRVYFFCKGDDLNLCVSRHNAYVGSLAVLHNAEEAL